MSKIVTLGEIMLRLSPEGNDRFIQSDSFRIIPGGGEANVAVSLANYGHEAYFVSKLPKHEIGQIAINVPSNAAVAVSITGRCHTRTASITEIRNEPIAALNVGHFIFSNAKASQIIGANPKINNMKLIFPLRALNSIISIHLKIEQFKMLTLTHRKKIK